MVIVVVVVVVLNDGLSTQLFLWIKEIRSSTCHPDAEQKHAHTDT